MAGKEKHHAATGCFIAGWWGPRGAEATCPCVQDPSGNRIAQWREVTPRQGIVDLSLPLAAEPALGTYTIEVEGKRHSFSVEEYGMEEPTMACPCGQHVLATPGHPGTVVLVLGVTTLSLFAFPSVLPKFEMTIDLPAVVLEKDKKFQMEICGR